MTEQYDLCVIGAGTAGFAAAEQAHEAGRRVILASGRGELGGTCILRGCMPAKALLASSDALKSVDRLHDLGVETTPARINLPAIIARKRTLVDEFAADRVEELERYPIVREKGRFVDGGTLEAGGRRIEAKHFLVATGSRIVAPPAPKLTKHGYLTSDDALEMTEVPDRITILGGGPVGCEFAQYFARLGARVTLLQQEPQLLRNEDPDLAGAIRKALEDDGVAVMTGVDFAEARLGGERVLLVAERRPNVHDLGLDRAGVALEGAGIAVDAMLRTSNPRIWAAGDVLGRRFLVHFAEYTGRLAAANAFAAQPQPAQFERFEAHAVATEPELAVAGITERTAGARGYPVRVARHEFADVGKALVADQAAGFIKMLADPDGRIVGVAIVGANATELLGEGIVLIDRGVTVHELAATPHLHPTMSEIYVRVAEDLAARVAVSPA